MDRRRTRKLQSEVKLDVKKSMTTVIPEIKKETKLEDCHACKPD